MSSDGIWCMHFFWRRKTLKTRNLVSSQAVLHTNNATIGKQNKENNKIFQNKGIGIQKEIQDHYIATFKKKEGKRRWIKQQIHQLNTMQKTSIEEFIQNYTQPIKSASHHQRWAKLANQQASNAARDQSKKAGSPPNQIHIIQKREAGEGERTTEKRQKYRGMQEEEPVHMKRHWKNMYMMWRREREAERVDNPSKCAIPLMNKQKQQDAVHTYRIHLTACLHWI